MSRRSVATRLDAGVKKLRPPSRPHRAQEDTSQRHCPSIDMRSAATYECDLEVRR
jgi:hypothetical protein